MTLSTSSPSSFSLDGAAIAKVVIPSPIAADPVEPDPATAQPTTVLIVDDHRSFADLLAAALNTVPSLRCVGTASTAPEGIARAAELRPGIVVMDIRLHQHDGLAACRRIREASPETVIAVVTAHREPEWISRSAQAGASAFIPKNGSLKEMLHVLSNLRSGQMMVAPSAYDGPPMSPPGSGEPAPSMTPRELDVLRCLGKGMAAKGIARVLGISMHTCRGHVKSLHSKLGASSQLEAVVKAQALGLIGTGGHPEPGSVI